MRGDTVRGDSEGLSERDGREAVRDREAARDGKERQDLTPAAQPAAGVAWRRGTAQRARGGHRERRQWGTQ